MKRIKLLVIVILFGTGVVNANPVNVNVAQKAAQNFYATAHSSIAPDMSLAYTERDASGAAVYYVFNITASSKGFVIVTAEDATHPIIGYSDEGSFVIPASNNNVSFWLQKRKNEVLAIRAQNIAATSDVTEEWTSYTSGSIRATHNVASNSVLPMCQTYWNQSPYYNAYCPGGSVTGCVATAMAQILKYWQYPSIGAGNNCYNGSYGELCANFDTSYYVWSAMQNTPLGENNDQIAKLMYDCGVSVNMNYSPTGSGAYVMGGYPSAEYSYTNYFGYDPTTIGEAFYDSTQQASWITFLEGELNNHRPMQFQGFDLSEGGHSWVCDGYSALNMMHMNWGWGGYDDGYYYVNSLTPSPLDFTYNIGVLYGIQPPDGLGVAKISPITSFKVYPNPGNGIFNVELESLSGNPQITVYNVLGQQVYSSKLTSVQTSINLSNQAKGVYLYKVLDENGVSISTGRLVIE